MLDLTLDHLGIQTEAYTGDPEADDVQRTIKDGLEEIVSLCGKGESCNCRHVRSAPDSNAALSRVSKAPILRLSDAAR
jgi:hypothetical protein